MNEKKLNEKRLNEQTERKKTKRIKNWTKQGVNEMRPVSEFTKKATPTLIKYSKFTSALYYPIPLYSNFHKNQLILDKIVERTDR